VSWAASRDWGGLFVAMFADHAAITHSQLETLRNHPQALAKLR
jgi:hypothetical protein